MTVALPLQPDTTNSTNSFMMESSTNNPTNPHQQGSMQESFSLSNSRLLFHGSSNMQTSFSRSGNRYARSNKSNNMHMSGVGEESMTIHSAVFDDSVPALNANHHNSSTKSFQKSVKFSAQNFVPQRQGKLEEHYRIGDLLGQGGFGDVFAAVDIATGAERAIKVVQKHTEDPSDNDAIIQEFNTLKQLDHPNVLKLFELLEDDLYFYIVTDLYRGGDLYDEIQEFGGFVETDAAVLINTILSCVNYFHKNNLAHRDLKPENILLDSNKTLDGLKIIDFGMASFIQANAKLTDRQGTVYFLSPQVIKGCHDARKADIWSLGCLTYVCIAGSAPFDGESEEEIISNIANDNWAFEDAGWEQISEEARDFITSLLTYDEEARPTAEQALNHPWLQAARANVRVTPSQRASTCQSLAGMQTFQAQHSKLKQAVCSLIASQLLSKEEKEGIDVVFRFLDVDCDGRLTKDDIRQSYSNYCGRPINEDEITNMFAHVNFSGSGAIEYSEFAVASLMENNLINERKVDAAFRIFDAEKKGYISVDNLKVVLQLDDSMDDYIVNKIIRQVNKNANGKISPSDFHAMMFAHHPQSIRQLSYHSSKFSASSSRFGMSRSLAMSFAINEDIEDVDDFPLDSYSCEGSTVMLDGSSSFGNLFKSVTQKVQEMDLP